MAALARAHGFCTEHAEMLLRIDFQMQSMLGIFQARLRVYRLPSYRGGMPDR
jgi:hypothetical protein